MPQENRTQEPSSPPLASGELTATDLALVAGGTEGPPTSAGDHNGRSGM